MSKKVTFIISPTLTDFQGFSTNYFVTVSYFNAIFRFSDSSLFFLFKSSDRSFIAVTISINIKGIRIVGEPSEIEIDGMIYKAANNCRNNQKKSNLPRNRH
jgi:hypothetical protein